MDLLLVVLLLIAAIGGLSFLVYRLTGRARAAQMGTDLDRHPITIGGSVAPAPAAELVLFGLITTAVGMVITAFGYVTYMDSLWSLSEAPVVAPLAIGGIVSTAGYILLAIGFYRIAKGVDHLISRPPTASDGPHPR